VSELVPCGRYLGHGEQCDYPRAESAELCGFHLTEDNVKLHRQLGRLNTECEQIGEKADEAWQALAAAQPQLSAGHRAARAWRALDVVYRGWVQDVPELAEALDALAAVVPGVDDTEGSITHAEVADMMAALTETEGER